MIKKEITVVAAIGIGDTELSAFDQALLTAGVSDFNLIPLSSVIPSNYNIKVRKKAIFKKKPNGEKLYVVMAHQRTCLSKEQAWAGLGWALSKREGFPGLFVEHHGTSKKDVSRLIARSLKNMTENRGGSFHPIQQKIIGTTARNKAVCALVLAVYQMEKWDE